MLDDLIKKEDIALESTFKQIDKLTLENSEKVIMAFQKEAVSNSDFYGTTGYGYGDIGRDKIEKLYADIFHAEDALVREQFISGTHALTTAFFGILRPGDTLLSITGMPYDTLWPVIGITPNDSSLEAFNIHFKAINLKGNDFDYQEIKTSLKGIKMVHIQRSIGYSERDSISIQKLKKVITMIKEISPKIIIMVDNCYCELCDLLEPTDVNADIVVGSLIKNLGAGMANNGAYICGKKDLIKLCAERLNVPGQGKEIGPSLGFNRSLLMGLYFAPMVVGNALKVKALTNYLMINLGYKTINSELNDIVLGIVFNDQNKLIDYVQNIQRNSAVDSSFMPICSDMPGYDDQIIMASGSFTDGSSIELSCDGPIRRPYIAYQQGSLSYLYGKIAVEKTIRSMLKLQ